jgi:hypothetical protein
MSGTLARILELAAKGEIRVSEHGYEELAADGIVVRDLVAGLRTAEPVEEYPEYPKGPCVLLLHRDSGGRPVHALWGIPRGLPGPAVLVTAYRPEPDRWTQDFKRRLT